MPKTRSEYEPAARLLADTYNNFGDKTQAAIPQLTKFGDSLARLQTRYAFASIGEVIYALQYAAPAAKAAGVAFNEMNATIGLLSESGLHGAEAGTAAQTLFSDLASILSWRVSLCGTPWAASIRQDLGADAKCIRQDGPAARK